MLSLSKHEPALKAAARVPVTLALRLAQGEGDVIGFFSCNAFTNPSC